MRGIKPSLVLASVAVVGLSLWAAAQIEPSGSRMAVAADRLLSSLSSAQATKVVYPYDAKERFDWHFIPRGRKGLPIKELSPEHRALAFGLIQSGLSGSGFLKASTIMSLEQVLKGAPKTAKARCVTPELYYLTIFGKPVDSGRVGAGGLKGIICPAPTSGWKTARSCQPRRLSSAPIRGRSLQGHARDYKRSPSVTSEHCASDSSPGRHADQESGSSRRKAPGGDPRTANYAATAGRPGRWHHLRGIERRSEGQTWARRSSSHTPRTCHSKSPRPGLTRSTVPGLIRFASPGPARPTAVKGMRIASRGRPS